MKKLLFLLMILIMPITVFAATEIGMDDLAAAKSTPDTVTAKGIRYYSNGGHGCYHFSNGDYKILEDITLNNEKLCFLEVTVNLDLNNKTITYETDDPDFGAYPIHAGASDLTITGNGVVTGGDVKIDGGGSLTIKNGTFNGDIDTTATNLTIEGGTFNSDVSMYGADQERMGNVYIKGGTFNGDVYFVNILNVVIDGGESNTMLGVTEVGSLTINGGKFHGAAEHAVFVDSTEEVTINGGYFEAYVAADIENADNIEINGGTFVGYLAALGISYPDIDPQTVSLKGGTFKATGLGQNSPYGALVYADSHASDDAEGFILTWVADGFKYDPEVTVKVVEDLGTIIIYGSQNEISVVPVSVEPSDDEEETPEKKEEKKEEKKNPATVDNISMYALLTLVSSAGLITIRKCKKD